MLDNFDKKKNPFSVPENYFEELTQNVMNNLPAKELEVKRVSLWRKVLPWTGVAAVVAVVVISVGTWGSMSDVRMADNAKGKEMVKSQQNMAYNDAEDYFLFLEDESIEAQYYEDVLFDEGF